METSLKAVIARLAEGALLSEAESEAVFGSIMAGEATPAQIAAIAMLLRLRGETVGEIVGAVQALRSRMIAIEAPDDAIDVCGTGGDARGTLNISTAVSFAVAALGVPVAKHGNRALSSKAGAADTLAELGVRIELPVDRLAAVLREAGLVFLFAPAHHPALRHAAGPRVELGTRTIFNLLGPLANPARVPRQLTGVFHPKWLVPMAEVLGALGTRRAWLVHGQGLDELSLAGTNVIAELKGGRVTQRRVEPEEAGLGRYPIEAISGGTPAENAIALVRLLEGEKGPYRDTVLINAAAALVVAERADTLREGVAQAATAIDSGAALAALDRLRAATA